MSFKVVKVVAVPVVLGFASIRVYTMSEPKTEHLLLPRELTIYSTESQERLHYVDEQPGALQRGLGKVRGGLQSAFLNVKGAYVSAKSTAVNLYHGGEDIYHFLKDPPSGFVPRVALITVSGLAGVILARKGSRLKRLALPLSMITAGFAVCYPVQTISTLKVSGKRIYAASTWTSSTVSSLWKSPASSESAPSPENVPVTSTALTKPTEETEAAGTEESSQEVPPPTEPSLIPMPEAEAAPNPVLSVSISETEQTVPSVEEELLVKSDEEKTAAAAASSSSDETKPETSLQSSTEAETATVVAEKRNPGVDPSLMDFGQSNPEDADLYSTRS